MKSLNKDSYMLHTSNIELSNLGAEALELPIVYGETQGHKESELEDISETIRLARSEFRFTTIASGALASKYQKDRVDKIAHSLGLSTVAPLWQIEQSDYLRSIVDEGYKFILTSVSCAGLDDAFLGKVVDPEIAEKIISRSKQFHFNPAFEGGEAETLVLDCPLFRKKKIKIERSKIIWNGYSGSLEIEKASLEEK
jgi:diphthine-ammonia ligase